MVNVPYLKGIHYAMHAGMYAAEGDRRVPEAGVRELRSLRALRSRKSLIEEGPLSLPGTSASTAGQGVSWRSAPSPNAWLLSRGAVPPGHKKVEPDTEVEVEIEGAADNYPKPDGSLHLRQALVRVSCSGNATRGRRPPNQHPHPGTRAEGDRPERGSRCARHRSTRSPMTRSSRAPRPSTST